MIKSKPQPSTEPRPAIEVNHLTVSYGPVPALLDVSFKIPPGQLIGIIGPNGSGKSTLIKTLLGFMSPDFGNIRLYGQPIEKSRGRVAYVPQRGAVDWDFPVTVREVVLMGRYGHVPWYRDLGRKEHDIANHALELVRMTPYADRQIGQLSGGQQQRVFMARAMAQGGDILLLDEPFAGVDAATENAILEVLKETRSAGKTLVVVHHDLSTAATYFDALLLLKQRLYAYGPANKILNPTLLSEVYEGQLQVFSNLGVRSGAAEEPA